MAWFGWFLLLAAVYLVVVVVRGLIQFGSWLWEEFIDEPRERRRLQERLAEKTQAPSTAAASSSGGRRERRKRADHRPAHPISHSHASVKPAVRPRRTAGLMRSVKALFVGRRYDYWVALALAEEDAEKKAKYLAKALELDPGYCPAWGLRGTALLELNRYDEALLCFDKLLEMRPSPIAWYRKGLCCYHLKRHEEAVRCLDKALAAPAGMDRELSEDALRTKGLAAAELGQR